MDKDKLVLKELSVTDGEAPAVGVFRVLRSFYLPVRKGPNISLPVGALVELSAGTAQENFLLNRVIPHDPAIPALGKYRALLPFRVVLNDIFVDVKAEEFLELTSQEALPFLQRQQIALEAVLQ